MALIWKSPCSLWPMLSGWPVPLSLSPSFQGPSDDPFHGHCFPCYGCPCPVSASPSLQVPDSRIRGVRIRDALHTTSHHSRGIIVIVTDAQSSCSQTITPGSSWEQHLEKGRLRPWEQAGRDLLSQLCLFQDSTKATRSGAQKWPLTRNTRLWKWGKVSCLFVFAKLDMVLPSRKNVFLTLNSPIRN